MRTVVSRVARIHLALCSPMSTVLLLHGAARVGQSLGAAIAGVDGVQLLAVVASVAEARAVLARETPDLFIADLLQPGGNLLALLQSLRAGAGAQGDDSRPQVLVLGASIDDPRLVEAMRHGADGYFMPGRPALLIAAVEQVLRGESSMTPQIAREVMAHFDAAMPALRLNDADRSLLQWTAEGYLVNEVARGLRVTPQAVALRMRAIYRKLQFDVRAKRLGLLAA
jgi:DNA-binding NarL/FixJ family response regulator